MTGLLNTLFGDFWTALTAILAALAAFLGLRGTYHKGKAKEAKRRAERAETEIRRHELIEEADEKRQIEYEKIREEVKRANLDELIERLSDPDR